MTVVAPKYINKDDIPESISIKDLEPGKYYTLLSYRTKDSKYRYYHKYYDVKLLGLHYGEKGSDEILGSRYETSVWGILDGGRKKTVISIEILLDKEDPSTTQRISVENVYNKEYVFRYKLS